MQEETSKLSNPWTDKETLLLLKCYEKRKLEFDHPHANICAYENVLQDMHMEGFMDKSATATLLRNKMETLVNTYHTAKDAERHTHVVQSVIPFETQLDELLSNSAIACHTHSLSIGQFAAKPLCDDYMADSACSTSNHEEDRESTVPNTISLKREKQAMKRAYQEMKKEYRQTFQNLCSKQNAIEAKKIKLIQKLMQKRNCKQNNIS